ncbi:type II toxin-antitoxin system PemK/MazF family toxin [Butyrivibrio sp. INlla16]|uniref:type II toxin-antitoxin system PemK/MazF family toxin n=1 Tax=Butyrivibrio sp. INlla16 TaxID=1520807 RepID=UPI000883A875|nr:mRNA interferase MazF [Butyrivibrio sp. INlla16]
MNDIKRGDIYLADLGEGIGSEQHGVRPVLVVQNNIGNKYSPTVTVLPITTKIHKSRGLPTHVMIDHMGGLDEKSSIMAEQISTIDKTKLFTYIGTIPEDAMKKDINEAIRIQLGLPGRKRYGRK